jgi:hypothetical protein
LPRQTEIWRGGTEDRICLCDPSKSQNAYAIGRNFKMDQTHRTALKANELNPINLIDAFVYNAEDLKIGKVAHVFGEGLAVEVIVDIGGSLLTGPKPVSLPASQLEFSREENGLVHIKICLSEDELALRVRDTPPDRR